MKTKAEIKAMEQTSFFGGKDKKAPSSLLETGSPEKGSYWDTRKQAKDLQALGDKLQQELGGIAFDPQAHTDQGSAGFQHLTGASSFLETEPSPTFKGELDMVDGNMKRLQQLSVDANKRAQDVMKLESVQAKDIQRPASSYAESLLETGSKTMRQDLFDHGDLFQGLDPSLFNDPKLNSLTKKVEDDKDKVSDLSDKFAEQQSKIKEELQEVSSGDQDRANALKAKLDHLKADSDAKATMGKLSSFLETAATEEDLEFATDEEKAAIHKHAVSTLRDFTKTPQFKAVASMAGQSTSSLLEMGISSEQIAAVRGLVHAMSKKPEVEAMDKQLADAEARISTIQSKVATELSALNKRIDNEGGLHSSLLETGAGKPKISHDLVLEKQDLEKTHAITNELKLKVKEAREKVKEDFKKNFAQFGVTYDDDDESEAPPSDDADAHADDDDDSDSLLQERRRRRPRG